MSEFDDNRGYDGVSQPIFRFARTNLTHSDESRGYEGADDGRSPRVEARGGGGGESRARSASPGRGDR
jgi:hypothetical protein